MPEGLLRRKARRERGFTLIELVVVLAILGILISLAVPRYLNARKKAYKAEADNILQEAKTLEWAYYQQYNSFDDTAGMTNISMAVPSGLHWNAPTVTGGYNNVTITMSGSVAPLASTDSVWITLSGDGSSSGGSSF
jgi:prepilin-type N-terminal cleavage/methylation domain-containing protein